jgi:hypothetical protein
MIQLDGHTLVFPYGSVALVGARGNGSVFRMVGELMAHAGTVVPYAVLSAAMWPDVPSDARMRHAMNVAVFNLNEMARDLGMLALITVASDVGYSWSPTEGEYNDRFHPPSLSPASERTPTGSGSDHGHRPMPLRRRHDEVLINGR